MLIGATGVLLWPLFLLGATRTYPAVAHARLMMEGMMSCFIFGFLGTAGPRVLSVPHFSGAEVLRLAALIAGATLAHLYGWHAFADTLFLLALVLLVASLAHRFLRRKDSPPANFALVGLGILNGVAGTAMLVFCEWAASASTLSRLGSSLLNVGFVLLPVLGVALFFLRRLLDLASEDDIAETRRPKLALAIFVGLTIDASLGLELFSSHPAIGGTRCATALGYIVITLPRRGSNALAASLRMSLAAVAAALGLMAILPAYRISAMHVLFRSSPFREPG